MEYGAGVGAWRYQPWELVAGERATERGARLRVDRDRRPGMRFVNRMDVIPRRNPVSLPSNARPRRANLGTWSGLDTDRKSTRLNSSHVEISYAVFCLKK